MTKSNWNIIFAYLSLFYLGLADNIRGPLYPDIVQEFSLSHSEGSWFFALSSMAGLLGSSFIFRRLKINTYKICFQFSLGLMVLSQFLYAMSPTFLFFLISSFVLGFSIGSLGVIQNILVLVASSPERLSRLMSGLHASYGGASLFAPLLVMVCWGLGSNLRMSFWVTGFIGLFLLATSLKIPDFLQARQEPQARPPMRFSRSNLLLAASLALYVLAEILTSTRLAHFCRSHLLCNPNETSLRVALFFGGLFLGRLSLALRRLPWSLRRQVSTAFCLTAIFAILGIWGSPWFFGLVGFFMAPCYPLIMSILKEEFPEQIESVTTICIFASGLSVVSMHLGVGLISDQMGIQSAMFLIPCACLLSLGCLVMSKSTRSPTL